MRHEALSQRATGSPSESHRAVENNKDLLSQSSQSPRKPTPAAVVLPSLLFVVVLFLRRWALKTR